MYGVMHTKKFFLSGDKLVYLIAAIMSIVFSISTILHNSLINPDAICYLFSADEMKLGIHSAMNICAQAKWPFYSAMVYALSKIISVSTLNSAYILDSLFTLISVLTFIAIVNYISPKSRLVWLGALVILLAHEFNSVRQDIIRDHGYWAFYLLSIYFLLHYFREPQIRYALLWNISAIIATLFRVEGAVFLLFIPFLVIPAKEVGWAKRSVPTKPRDDRSSGLFLRIKSYIQLNLINITALIILGVLFHRNLHVGRIDELQFQLMSGISNSIHHFTEMKQSLAKYILTEESLRDCGIILCLTLIFSYVINVVSNLSFIYTALIIYAWIKQLMPKEFSVKLVLYGYLLINIVVSTIFYTEHLFLSKRYLIALSLVLMIWVPFALDELFKKLKPKLSMALIILIFLTSIGGIISFGYSKKYIRQAGDWMATNVPEQASVYSNDYQLMYYSQHFGKAIFSIAKNYFDIHSIENDKWKQYDYLAIRLNKYDSPENFKIVNQIRYPLAYVFANNRGDQIRIYQRKSL